MTAVLQMHEVHEGNWLRTLPSHPPTQLFGATMPITININWLPPPLLSLSMQVHEAAAEDAAESLPCCLPTVPTMPMTNHQLPAMLHMQVHEAAG